MKRSIRNFAIISHIDHGKSTLADRLMELTGLLPPLLPAEKRGTPRIDRMELEVERGVTIKLKAVRMEYHPQIRNPKHQIPNKFQIHPSFAKATEGAPRSLGEVGQNSNSLGFRNLDFGFPCSEYILNMVDTPGHADFSYEVSRSLAACEGALLLVDATHGPQAQTVAHLEKARNLGLTVIGVINKIDSPLAQIEETEREMRTLGIEGEILRISALKGEGIEAVVEGVAARIPNPKGSEEEAFRALIFDSTYDEHLGVIAYVRVVDGRIEARGRKQEARIKFLGTGVEARVKEVGYFTPERKPAVGLSAGEVGYIATGLKDPQAVRVGDTIVLINQLTNQPITQLPGYKEPRSFVFASFFPTTADFSELKGALSKLRLEEPAISVEETSSPAFGRGFKLGFLGTFHLEIVKERLEREFDLELVVTKPTVGFRGIGGDKGDRDWQGTKEPWIKVTIITPPEYLSGITRLVTESRGEVGEVTSFGAKMKLLAELPLMEFIRAAPRIRRSARSERSQDELEGVVRGFYDRLKSLSSGYASLDWEFLGYRSADLVKLDVAVHGEVVEGLSEIVLKDQAPKIGREKVKRLKEIVPQQQFAYALQAKVGGKVLAREDVPAIRKDVTAPLYGGDVTRKRKLLEKQKKGKKKLAKFGRVEVPPEAFLV